MRKSILRILSIPILPIMLSACSNGGGKSVLNKELWQSNKGVMVVAHRACWRHAPENSIAAINRCIELGIDMIEIDVALSKDGQLLVIHDKTLDRTTNGSGKVSQHNLAELKKLRLKTALGGDTAELSNSSIPTLEQALLAAKDKILVNLDAKADIRPQAIALAKRLGMSEQILIKSTASRPQDIPGEDLASIQQSNFMPIIKQKHGDMGQQVNNFKHFNKVAFELIYQSEDALKNACQQARQQQARCWVNTMWPRLSPGHHDDIAILKPNQHWGKLISLGVNMIQTDRPEELITYLKQSSD